MTTDQAGSLLRRAAAHLPSALKRPLRAAIRGITHQHVETPTGSIDPAELFPIRQPLPNVPGVDVESLRTMLASLSIENSPSAELRGYLDDCFYRALHTWKLSADLSGSALELGANPYFITTLLSEHTQLDLHLANYFGESHVGSTIAQQVTYERPDGSAAAIRHESAHFNLEEERFPWPDAAFDVVFFCEILEHLLMDPVRVLREIRRVLKPSGHLILTTPNVDRLQNVMRVIEGSNIYDPYSGYGPYGRHNREYNRHELHLLLGYMGFVVEESFTGDAHDWHFHDAKQLRSVEPLIRQRQNDLGQYLFVRARAATAPRELKPEFLYRSYPPEELEQI